MADGLSNVALNMELYEGKDLTICLTGPYHGSYRRVVADSWFGSVKSAVELRKCGLFSIMLVKVAHKNFP